MNRRQLLAAGVFAGLMRFFPARATPSVVVEEVGGAWLRASVVGVVATPELEDWVRRDITRQIAELYDRKFRLGESTEQPRGILNQ